MTRHAVTDVIVARYIYIGMENYSLIIDSGIDNHSKKRSLYNNYVTMNDFCYHMNHQL